MTANGDNGVASWDEARQLGQLFMMGFDGTSINNQVRILIEKYYVGSILLTAKNLKSAAQTKQLVLDLQNLAHNAGHSVPLLIAIDQENGVVNSLYDETCIRQFPSAMGVAAIGSPSMAKSIATATAQELALCGINWIMGPVMDVLTNAKAQPLGVRSFGEDPQTVSTYVVETLKGYHQGGLATCGKHFPSYGNLEFFGAPNDVPTITDTLEHLSQTALVPFRNSIAQGVDAMMVGGVALTSPNLNIMHACLSEQVIRDLLRTDLHFEGVVVSECLEMEALSRNIGISGGTVMAFNAGCDVLLTCRNLSVQEEAINGLKAGLDNGMIERLRVQEALQRIMTLKHRYTTWEKALSTDGMEKLAKLQNHHFNLSTSAYKKSITVVRDQNKHLPLSKTIREDQEILLLTPLVKALPGSAAHHPDQDNPFTTDWDFSSPRNHSNTATDPSITNGETVFRDFGRLLSRQRHGKVMHTSYTSHGVRPFHENLLSRASAVVVVTADAVRNLYQQGFTKHVSMLCKYNTALDGQLREIPCIVVAVSSPFDFVSDLSISTYVCTYDFTETALQALVKTLHGEPTLTANAALSASIQPPKTVHTRQTWLVEAFNEERDLVALSALLGTLFNGQSDANLSHVSAKSFLLRNTEVEESHFVVRNSTTKEVLGFCATYFSKSSMTGHIGAIFVDPKRRKLSIGRSLHDRAVRALLHRKGIQKIQLGVRLPNVYPGIPEPSHGESNTVRRWFNGAGWNMNVNNLRYIYSMVIQDLASWTPPEGLKQALSSREFKYDLVNGTEHAESIIAHVEKHADSSTQAMYKSALANKESCAIIRARKVSDGNIVGSVLLFNSQARMARFIPAVLDTTVTIGGLSSPVLKTSSALGDSAMASSSNGTIDGTEVERDQKTVAQGLLLLGTQQLKKQKIQRALLEYVDNPAITEHVRALGFTVWKTFEEVTSTPATWIKIIPT